MICKKIGLTLSFAFGIITNNVPKANALDFSFSFNNGDGNVGGSVTGIIKGLQSSGISGASEVDLTSYPSGLGSNPNSSGNIVYLSSGGGWGSPGTNSFTVTNGNLTNADFYTTGASGSFLALNENLLAAGANLTGLGLSVSALPSNRLTFGNTSPLLGIGGIPVGQIINNTGNMGVFTGANYAAVPFEFSPSEGIALGVPLFFGLRMLKRKKARALTSK